MNARSWLPGIGVFAALALHLQPVLSGRGRHTPPGFVVAPPVDEAVAGQKSLFRQERLDPGDSVPSVHVSSLCEPEPGNLMAAWYGGSREGSRDVAIFISSRPTPGFWSPPRPLVTAESAQKDLGHYVRKVGNPMIFAEPGGRVSLLYVAIAVGGWSGSSLCLKQSSDHGQTWTKSRRLVLSPFFNLSELVKNGPALLQGGGWAVPIYHELFGKFPEILWLNGTTPSAPAVRSRVFGGRTAFQPALVALDAQRALLLCRTASERRDLYFSRTSDGGRSWSAPQPSGLPNSDSGIDAIRLASGRLLLAFNDTNSGRANLRLATSSDGGVTWKRGPFIVAEEGEEFSYPFLLQTQDGLIHLSYTWKRRAIEVATFNEVWIQEPPTRGAP